MSGAAVWVSFLLIIHSPWSFFPLSTICTHYTYIQGAFAFHSSHFAQNKRQLCAGATVDLDQRRRQVSLEFTLLSMLIVMMVVNYIIYASPSLSCGDEELRNVIFYSFFLLHST